MSATLKKFEEIINATDESERAKTRYLKSFADLISLIEKNNANVARITAAKQNDPFTAENLDATWKTKIDEDDEMVVEFYDVAKRYEELLKKLRDRAKDLVDAPLSEEDATALRKAVNTGKDVIDKARARANLAAEIVDEILEEMGAPIPNGILSLLPAQESLLNTRGRKSSSDTPRQYSTRTDWVTIDGKEAIKTVTKQNGETEEIHGYVAAIAVLNREFNANNLPQNAVTIEELDTAYYASKGLVRGVNKQGEMPELHRFEFTKTIDVQKPNQEELVEETITKVIEVKRTMPKTADSTPAAPVAETPAPVSADIDSTPIVESIDDKVQAKLNRGKK